MGKRYLVGKTDPIGKYYAIGAVFPLAEFPMAEYDTKEEAFAKLNDVKRKDPKPKHYVYVILDRETRELITE